MNVNCGIVALTLEDMVYVEIFMTVNQVDVRCIVTLTFEDLDYFLSVVLLLLETFLGINLRITQ